GQTYAQTLVVHNDPRVGEGVAAMSALRSQNKLMMAAYQGMKDSYAGNDEVAALRAQVGALITGSSPDVAAAATALDAKLATVGGPTGRGGRGGAAAPGAGRGRAAA